MSNTGLTYGFVNAGGGGGGGGDCCKEGTYYIKVCAEGTPVQNAQEVVSAYTQAQSMSPSPTNIITIILSPGEYAFNGAFVLNTDYINLVTLTGNRDVIFDRADVVDPVILSPSFDVSYCMSLQANNVVVSGIQGKVRNSPNWDSYTGFGTTFRLPIGVNDGFVIYTFINCNGGDFGFGSDVTLGSNPITLNGIFQNCDAGVLSFAYYGTSAGVFSNCNAGESSFSTFGKASGTFTDCVGGSASFGAYGLSEGTFTNCKSGIRSFGSFGTASGTFLNCLGQGGSFGANGTADGTFIDCEGGASSFGGLGTASGIFINCRGDVRSFAGQLFTADSASGTFINCTAGSRSFAGGGGTASGIFINCKGLAVSFGSLGDASGYFSDCVGGDGSFGWSNSASGVFNNCSGGINSFAGDGFASGNFTDCVGGSNSFGGSLGTASGTFHYCEGAGDASILTGNLYFCRLGSGGTFTTPTGGGSITLGIDGSNNVIII